jgi:hypothetical protein
MSVRAIESIEKFLSAKKEKSSIPLYEIIRRCEEFVKWREQRDAGTLRGTARTQYSEWKSSYCVREGKTLTRDKL